MEAIGIILPLIVVWVVHALLSTISRTLANVVVLVMIAAPIVWSLNELRKAGRECFDARRLVSDHLCEDRHHIALERAAPSQHLVHDDG